MAGAVLFRAGKKVFEVIKGSEKNAGLREVVDRRPSGENNLKIVQLVTI